MARVGVEPTGHQGLSLAALPVCVPCRSSQHRAPPTGFEPVTFSLTGRRAFRAAPRGHKAIKSASQKRRPGACRAWRGIGHPGHCQVRSRYARPSLCKTFIAASIIRSKRSRLHQDRRTRRGRCSRDSFKVSNTPPALPFDTMLRFIPQLPAWLNSSSAREGCPAERSNAELGVRVGIFHHQPFGHCGGVEVTIGRNQRK